MLLNNFSVLPWYKHTAEQDFRRWWKYGRIYPLYTPKGLAVPSQVFRSIKRTGYNIDTKADWQEPFQDNMYITASGIASVSAPGTVTQMVLFPIGGGGNIQSTDVIIVNAVERYMSYKAWAVLDSYWDVLVSFETPGEVDLNSYPTAAFIAVQYNGSFPLDDRVWIADNGTGVLRPRRTIVRTVEGEYVLDVSGDMGWDAVTRAEGDYLVCDGGDIHGLEIGQYYYEMTDGFETWVSDVFTAFNTAEIYDFLCIEWKDKADFVMDAGRIVYDNNIFKNRLYLRADLAKPEYEFEEEGETRDGYFYPTKQISKKKYNFHFFAPEYLLDVMRLIRMADEVTITYEVGEVMVTLSPTTFLLTPEWEREGDLAGVSAEFETDTVAKKVGLAYIREA